MGELPTARPILHKCLTALRCPLWITLSAYGLALTYFSDHFGPLAWVALIPFFLVIRHAGKRAAIGYGLLWGGIFFGSYGFVNAGTLTPEMLGFVLIGALSFAGLTLCINLPRERFLVGVVALSLAWLVYEVIRIELVLHSGALAATPRLEGPTLNILAITGLSGLTILIVVVNLCLVLFWDWLRTSRKRQRSHDWFDFPLLIRASEFVPGYAAFAVGQTGPRGPPVTGSTP